MATPSSPVGIHLDRKGRFTVGKEIGSGAQGSVHLVLKEGKETNWVVKLAILPSEGGASRKSKKEKLKQQNASSIFYESLMYTNHLVTLCGTILPTLPSSELPFPVFSKPGGTWKPSWNWNHVSSILHQRFLTLFLSLGYNALCIERMKLPFFSIIDSFPSSGSFRLSVVVDRLIDIVQTIHQMGYLLVDVKPDNFMLVNPKGSSVDAYASAIRILDLAMLQTLRDPLASGVRSNEGIASLVGTPLYASRNVHNLQSPTRRDDIESLIYIIAEIFIRYTARLQGNESQYIHKNGIDSFLPWSQGKSDGDIGQTKSQMVEDIASLFYQRMPKNIATAIHQALVTEIASYDFKHKPNYSKIKNILDVTINLTATQKKGSPSRGKRRNSSSASSNISPKPSKKERVAPTIRSDPMEIDSVDDSSVEIIDPPKSKRARKVPTSASASSSMDVDMMSVSSNEGKPKDASFVESAKENKKTSSSGLWVEIKEGPKKLIGKCYSFEMEGTISRCVGTKPKEARGRNASKESTGIAVQDPSMKENHARFTIEGRKKAGAFHSLRIAVDAQKNGEVYVNDKNVTGTAVAFPGSKIRVGETVFLVSK